MFMLFTELDIWESSGFQVIGQNALSQLDCNIFNLAISQ